MTWSLAFSTKMAIRLGVLYRATMFGNDSKLSWNVHDRSSLTWSSVVIKLFFLYFFSPLSHQFPFIPPPLGYRAPLHSKQSRKLLGLSLSTRFHQLVPVLNFMDQFNKLNNFKVRTFPVNSVHFANGISHRYFLWKRAEFTWVFCPKKVFLLRDLVWTSRSVGQGSSSFVERSHHSVH